MTSPFNDQMPVAAARAVLRDHLADGIECPCCAQHAREYKRPLTAVAARALAALWRVHGTTFGHLPTVARDHLADVSHQGGYLVLSAHWGLMIPETLTRDDGRAGYWAVTAKGTDWLLGRAAVPKYARIYNGDLVRLEGPAFTVLDAFAGQFDLDELLGPRDPDPEPGMPLQLFPPSTPEALPSAAAA